MRVSSSFYSAEHLSSLLIRLDPGLSGQRFLFGFPLFPTSYNPLLSEHHPSKEVVRLCESINEPQGVAVKSRPRPLPPTPFPARLFLPPPVRFAFPPLLLPLFHHSCCFLA